MFYKKLKKEAIHRLEELQKEYIDKSKLVESTAIELYSNRKNSLFIIEQAEMYIYNLINMPEVYLREMEDIEKNKKDFNYAVELEKDSIKREKIKDSSIISDVAIGTAAVGSAAIGAGIATFGPTTAMAIATTFGTASTGTAIASLSGAAATNAALAWLGGGAIAAGGGGMAAGNALLGLMGPIGWGIGAVGMGLGIFTISSKNKKIAMQATDASFEFKDAINKIEKGRRNIFNLLKITEKMNNEVFMILKNISSNGIIDYTSFSDDEKIELKSLINSLKSLSILINKRLDGESMEEI